MKFRHVKTGSELIGVVQDGNRLRFEFPSIKTHHEGEYECEVSNKFGQKDTKTASIYVEGN